MKKLSIEEKAKCYDEAIEKLRNAFYDDNSRMCEEYREAVIRIIEPIFPELKDIDDDTVRKGIINFLNHFDSLYLQEEFRLSQRDCISWLERQGEHKSTWNEDDEKMLGKCIDAASGYYSPEDKQNIKDWLRSIKYKVQPQQKKTCSLTDEYMINFISKKLFSLGATPLSKEIEWLNSLKKRINTPNTLDVEDVDLEKEIDRWQGCEAFPEGVGISPLPKAMEIVERTAKYFFELGLKAAQNFTTWSKGDKWMIKNICNAFEKGSSQYIWLKSLEEKVQPKQEWRQIDNELADDAIACVDRCYERYKDNKEFYQSLRHNILDIKRWLIDVRKRLTPHWKPSDEQMKGIECALNQLDGGDKRLNSLYNDLKKL